ncbi:MAG: hypothetical protein ABSE56_04655 [Bryobacteraceae bacterium]
MLEGWEEKLLGAAPAGKVREFLEGLPRRQAGKSQERDKTVSGASYGGEWRGVEARVRATTSPYYEGVVRGSIDSRRLASGRIEVKSGQNIDCGGEKSVPVTPGPRRCGLT